MFYIIIFKNYNLFINILKSLPWRRKSGTSGDTYRSPFYLCIYGHMDSVVGFGFPRNRAPDIVIAEMLCSTGAKDMRKRGGRSTCCSMLRCWGCFIPTASVLKAKTKIQAGKTHCLMEPKYS